MGIHNGAFVKSAVLKNIAKGMAMGAQFISLILGGVLLGWFLDQHLNTEPVCLIVGILTGLSLGVYQLIRLQDDAE